MNRQRIFILALVGVASLWVALCGANVVSTALWGSRVRRASIGLEEGYNLEIWDKYPSLDQWDPDISKPTMYYRVLHNSKVIIAEDHLPMIDFNYQYSLKVAFAANKTLVCVYDEQLWGDGLFIIFDKTTEMAWAEPDNEDWLARYKKLILENPGLPRFSTIQ